MGAVTYWIDGPLITLAAEGEHTMADVQAALDGALHDPRLGSEVLLLIDVCKSTGTPGPNEIRMFAEFLRTVPARLPASCAVLTCDALRYGLSMELSGWASARGVRIRVFAIGENDKARSWLLSGAPEAASEGWPLGVRTPN